MYVFVFVSGIKYVCAISSSIVSLFLTSLTFSVKQMKFKMKISSPYDSLRDREKDDREKGEKEKEKGERGREGERVKDEKMDEVGTQKGEGDVALLKQDGSTNFVF